MNKKLLAGMVAALAALSPTALAADHGDGQIALGNPTLDITDIFTWTDQADATKLDLVMDVTPSASKTSVFSDSGQYILNMTSYASYGAPLAVPPKDLSKLLCTFTGTASPQTVSCWLIVNGTTVDYITGDASATTGINSVNGYFRIFTGARQDPFFFNLDGFKDTLQTVETAASGLTFNAQGCPAVDPTTSTTLVNELATGPEGVPPVDDFAGLDVLSIVVQLKTAAITPSDTASSTHPVIGVWGSTRN